MEDNNQVQNNKVKLELTSQQLQLRTQALDFIRENNLKHLNWRVDVNRFQVYVAITVNKKARRRFSFGYVKKEDAKIGSQYAERFKQIANTICKNGDKDRDNYPDVLAIKNKLKRELRQVLKY